MTLRDEVWDAVLKELCNEGRFTIGELPFAKSQRHTVRRVLREMEGLDWLARRDKRAATWCAGETAALHLNISPDKLREAKEEVESETPPRQ